MNLQPGRQLAALIEKEGVGIADDPQRIKAHLLDSSPESRTETELLVAGATDGLASRLARSSETVFRDGEIARAIADLKRTRRLDQQAADWVVRSWAWALGVTDTEPSDEEPSGDTDNGTEPPSQGSAYTDQSGAPPQYETGPTSTPSSQPEALASSPQYGQPGSAPPYGQQTTPPSWPGSSPPAGTPSGPPWGHVASAPPQSAPSAPPLQSPSSQPPY